MTTDGGQPGEGHDRDRPGPRFVAPVPRPPSDPPPPVGEPTPVFFDPAAVPAAENPDLFTSRYVPFDGRGVGTTGAARSVARPTTSAPSRRRKVGLTGSRYVPIDGANALAVRPSPALLASAGVLSVAAVVLGFVLGASGEVERFAPAALAGAIAAGLAAAAVIVWRFGTARMAALTAALCAGLLCCIALGALALGDDSVALDVGPSALEDDFDLLYGRCEDDNDIACDLLYRTSWEGSVRSSFAEQLVRDCAGRGPNGTEFCTGGLIDADLDGLADPQSPGWSTIVASCERGDMLACDLAVMASANDSPERLIGATCGERRPSALPRCRSQFGLVADS